MHERDEGAFGAWPRLLVYQPDAVGLQPRERRVNVLDAQRDVVKAGTALLGESRDRRIGGGRLEQLEARVTGGDEARAHALRRHLFGRFDLEPERIAIEDEGGRQVAHGDAHVVEHGFHLLSRAWGPTPRRSSGPRARA